MLRERKTNALIMTIASLYTTIYNIVSNAIHARTVTSYRRNINTAVSLVTAQWNAHTLAVCTHVAVSHNSVQPSLAVVINECSLSNQSRTARVVRYIDHVVSNSVETISHRRKKCLGL